MANGGVGRALPAGFPRIQNQERSIAFGDRVTFSLRGQRESNQRERPPRLALAGLLSGKSVSRGRAFRQHIHVLAKRHRHPCRCPLRGLSTPTRRCRGAPVQQRAILARTFQKNHGKSRSRNGSSAPCGALVGGCRILAGWRGIAMPLSWNEIRDRALRNTEGTQ